MERRMEWHLYGWGIVFACALALAVTVKNIAFPELHILAYLPPCLFRFLTGFYCPGCGGSRSVAALLSGKFLTAAVDFPMVIYCAAVYVWYMVSHTLEWISRGRLAIGMKPRPAWLYGSLVVLAVHFLAKNIFYAVTGQQPFWPV